MHKNSFWLGFLVFITGIVLFYTGAAAFKVYQYQRLSNETLPEEINWSVKKKSGDSFLVKADYLFFLEEKEYQGETTFEALLFRNSWAAEEAIDEFKVRVWTVWYQPGSAENSTINKKFPLKEMLYTGTLWGLLLYFIWLGYYVSKYRIKEKERSK